MPVEAEELTGPARESLWATVPDYWKDYEKRAGIALPLMRLQISSQSKFPAKTGHQPHDNGTCPGVRY